MIKILNVVGARPNFMKMAPLIHAMKAHGRIRQVLVHTGQHYDEHLSEVFFRELEIPAPDFHLGIGSYPRDEQMSRISSAFEPVLLETAPDAVVVVGDVTSTLACAQVARKCSVLVVHVEAGLRSFDPEMPEEHNRIATDNLSDVLFVTEESGMENLKRERVPGKRFLVGNVMIDSLKKRLEKGLLSDVAAHLIPTDEPYVVMTIHRPSNVDRCDALLKILDRIAIISARVRIIFPLHPRTKAMLLKFGLMEQLGSIPHVTITEPLGYTDFVALTAKATAVITDSGGIQEETTYLGIPCITMRENTERPSTVTVGTNVLVGSDADLLISELAKALNGGFRKGGVPELWDGFAAPRIVDRIWEECRRLRLIGVAGQVCPAAQHEYP